MAVINMTALEEILAMMREFRSKVERAAEHIPDEEAEEMSDLFRVWKPDTEYAAGTRLQFRGLLYKVKDGQAHTSQSDWTPDRAISLYERVARPDETGDEDAPIAYSGNMVLEYGKLYTQDGVTYRCTRGSGIALTHPLAQLVGHYVEVV